MSDDYKPCHDGIHVCGADKTGDAPITVANFAGATRFIFDRMRQRYGYTPATLPGGTKDIEMVVDLMRGGDIADDFCIRRQSLNAMSRDIEAALAAPAKAPPPPGIGKQVVITARAPHRRKGDRIVVGAAGTVTKVRRREDLYAPEPGEHWQAEVVFNAPYGGTYTEWLSSRECEVVR